MNLLSYLKLLRPTQWVKNLMLFFPPFLGGMILQPSLIVNGIIPITSFCLASSATYIINDILDAENDLHHQKKRLRPIPSGAITIKSAAFLAFLFFTVSIIIGLRVSSSFLFFLLVYMAVAVLYSIKLKEFPVVDLFCVAAGFLFRLQAGGVAFKVEISEWLYLSVFLLAIFLSTGKRLCEKNALGENAGNHRRSLMTYPAGFLDGTMYMTGGAVLVTYTMYVIARHSLVYTVPVCCFGLLRYIFRVKAGLGGDPTESLLKDGPLLVISLIWVFMFGLTVYH